MAIATKDMTATRSNKRKVLIVDDHPVVREGLAMRLATQPDLEVCGEAEDMAGALARLASTRPDVAIIDISLKNSSGMELIRRIKDRDETIRILVWSMYPEALYAERALRAGAQGYLSKREATHHAVDAVRAILQGKVYISGLLTDRLVKRAIGRAPKDRAAVESLSDRELEVFQLMGEGMTTEAIAQRMHVSPKTVETFRARIKDKLEISNLTELVQRAAQWVMECRDLRE
jgi:DNA-binding NarL/FixJ family response regulator